MKQYKNIGEIAVDLYAMQSYFKNHVGFDRASNLLDKVRFELNVREDEIANRLIQKVKQDGSRH